MKKLLETLYKFITDHYIWRSMFRHGRWTNTPRHRAQHIINNVWLHLHPVKIRKRAVQFTYTWGLGGLSFGLFFVLVLSGIILMFYYRPTVHLAYQDIKDLTYVVSMGSFWRNFHRWSAHLMVLITIFHMIRVFLTGSYKSPREFNWVIGVILLILTLLLSFSGYLLPWDQIAIWAITVGANMASNTPFLGADGPFSLLGIQNDARFMMLGGTYVGGNALLRFYVLHCIAFPFLAGIFMIIHFWRIRKDGFSAAPMDLKNKNELKVDVWPHLVVKEYIYAVLFLCILVAWAIFVPAPLEEEANLSITPNPAKAPWYFLGLQELLVYFDPWIAGVVIPTLIVMGLIVLPYIDRSKIGVGYYSIKDRPFSSSIFLFGTTMWIVLIIIGTFMRGPNWAWYWPWESWVNHKSVPSNSWNLPNAFGGTLVVLYFFLGGLLPRLLGRSSLFFKKSILQCFFCVSVACLLFKLTLSDVFFKYSQQIFGFSQYIWVLFSSMIYYIFGFLLPSRYLKDKKLVYYVITMFFVLLMLAVFIKIGLRLGFNIKYVISFSEFNLNI